MGSTQEETVIWSRKFLCDQSLQIICLSNCSTPANLSNTMQVWSIVRRRISKNLFKHFLINISLIGWSSLFVRGDTLISNHFQSGLRCESLLYHVEEGFDSI